MMTLKKNIYKVYQHYFHFLEKEDKWSQHFGPYYISNPSKQQDTSKRSVISHMHNEINKSISNKANKYSTCKTK